MLKGIRKSNNKGIKVATATTLVVKVREHQPV